MCLHANAKLGLAGRLALVRANKAAARNEDRGAVSTRRA
jgi:hypothetical protein